MEIWAHSQIKPCSMKNFLLLGTFLRYLTEIGAELQLLAHAGFMFFVLNIRLPLPTHLLCCRRFLPSAGSNLAPSSKLLTFPVPYQSSVSVLETLRLFQPVFLSCSLETLGHLVSVILKEQVTHLPAGKSLPNKSC